MNFLNRKKGQGALEYLLLIGGAVLIAVIVIALLVSMGGKNKQNIQNQTQQVDTLLENITAPMISSAIMTACTATTPVVNLTFSGSTSSNPAANIVYSARLYSLSASGVAVPITATVVYNPTPLAAGTATNATFTAAGLTCTSGVTKYQIEVVATASLSNVSKSEPSAKYTLVAP
ncbi:MAG: class III signal peptide-containing protein [archaeon]